MPLIRIQEPRTAGLVRQWFNARGSISPQLDSDISLVARLFDGSPVQGRGVVERGFVRDSSNAAGDDVVAEWVNDGLPGPIARDAWLEAMMVSGNRVGGLLVQYGTGSISSGAGPSGISNEVLRDARALTPPLQIPLLSNAGRVGAGAATVTASGSLRVATNVTFLVPLGILLPQGQVFQVFLENAAGAGEELDVTLLSRHMEPGTNPIAP